MKRLTSNTRRWVLASLAAAALCANSAMAQSAYPNRPILMVVPQAAGGTNDIVGRIVSQKLGEVLNTAVAVENAPVRAATWARSSQRRPTKMVTPCS